MHGHPTEVLRLTLVQTDIVWQSPVQNKQRIASLLANIVGTTDVIVLPEMFTTGFTMQPEQWSESTEGPTWQWMKALAVEKQAAVVGSVAIEEDGSYYNRLYWVMPDGTTYTYDKRHLFTLAGEHLHYCAGTDRLVVDFKGWRIMPLVCYDIRFPVWSRNNSGYDLLLYIANFPDRRGHAWRSLLMARAIENVAYTVGLNRVGMDGNGVYHAGDSMLIGFDGRIHAHLPAREWVEQVTITKQPLLDFRDRMSFLNDSDEFTIKT
ncbi:MAG: amidohydrolase [Saprospiraceae bacterium]